MSLETGTFISDLVAANPVNGDPKSQGPGHFQLIKSTLKTTFPNVAGAVSASHIELSYSAGLTGIIQTQLNNEIAARLAANALLAPLASPSLTGIPVAPTAAVGNATTQLATTAFVASTAFVTALPGQAGSAGKFVTTDGANASWVAIPPATGATLYLNQYYGAF